MTNHVGSYRPSRRDFLLGVSAVAGVAALAGCSSGTAAGGAPANPAKVKALLPTQVPGQDYLTPAFPSVNGTPAIYTTYPKPPLPASVAKAPGNGSTIHAMQPIYGPVPPAGNRLTKAMNAALNANFDVSFVADNSGGYVDKLTAMLASAQDIPDWTVIPTWSEPPRFAEAVEARFEDLTPYLSGDNIKKYPNLAALHTNTWKYAVFNGKLMAVPYPNISPTELLIYRQDITDKLGLSIPSSTDDLLNFGKAATNARSGRWAFDNLWAALGDVFKVPPMWRIEGSKLVSRYETDEYAAALEFNAKLFKAGYVHPDATNATGDLLTRFSAGKTVLVPGNLLGWQQVVKEYGASVPEMHVQGIAPFAADGGAPLLWRPPAARMHNFFRKGTDSAKIEEMLRISNFFAAPYGTREYELKYSGKEGVDFTRDKNGVPITNKQYLRDGGTNGAYYYFGGAEYSLADVSHRQVMSDMGNWLKNAAKDIQDPAFYGINIIAPADLSGLTQQMTDFEADVFNGRKSVSDLAGARKSWRANGGDKLRDYYAQYLKTAKK